MAGQFAPNFTGSLSPFVRRSASARRKARLMSALAKLAPAAAAAPKPASKASAKPAPAAKKPASKPAKAKA